MALRNLLKIACGENVKYLQVFGDSFLLMDCWIQGSKQLWNDNLHKKGKVLKDFGGTSTQEDLFSKT